MIYVIIRLNVNSNAVVLTRIIESKKFVYSVGIKLDSDRSYGTAVTCMYARN
jgi:hypothetical protein